MTSVLYKLSGLENTHVKEELRDIGFRIEGLRNELTERIEFCERKLEEHDNVLINISSVLYMLSGLENTIVKTAIRDVDTRLELFKIDINNDITNLNDSMTSVLYMLDGIGNNRIKDLIRDLGLALGNATTDVSNLDSRVTVLEGIDIPDYSNEISDIDNDITNLNDNMTSVLYMLSEPENTHVKEELRDIGFRIDGLRNELTERIELCEPKLDEHDNILADLLSRLIAAGI
jgi:hypothetical protein